MGAHAGCGPNGLNTLVRHMVSDQIDLGKVLKGDPRGQVSLVYVAFFLSLNALPAY